jgi:hypothetical protein
VKNLRQLFLLDTNITPIQNNKMQRQAALHSALFNYTLEIKGTRKISSQPLLSQHKLALTAINKLLHYKIIGAPKKFKHHWRLLVRPSSLNFCQNF